MAARDSYQGQAVERSKRFARIIANGGRQI
jgi:hypothetical protein